MDKLRIHNFDDIKLFGLLDDSYRGAVEDLCLEACSLADRSPVFFPEYTLHNSVHLKRVAHLEGLVVGDRISLLKQDEIALLVLAAFYHDIGMVCDENEMTELRKSDEYLAFREEWRFAHPNMAELEMMHRREYVSEDEKISIGGKIHEMEKAVLAEFLRTRHPETSRKYVLQHLADHPVLGGLAEDLGEICLSHGLSVDWIMDHGSLTPGRKFICYVLRLADILDFDSDRTPDVLFRAISFSSPVSLKEWEKHRGVRDWTINEDEISFSMEYDHPAYEKAARDFIGWIDRELEHVHLAMRKIEADLPGYGIIAPLRVSTHIVSKGYEYHDLSFSLSRDEVVKLFLTDGLYGDKSLFVRELLQNSLDALRLRKAVMAVRGVEWSDGAVRLRHYLDGNGRSIVECDDNGCGMDLRILEQYFGKVGRSYYRSNEFERLRSELKHSGVDFDPCSRFGIGFMSVFMVADSVCVRTRKEGGEPYEVEINGLSNLFVIRRGADCQPVGTMVRVVERDAPPVFDSISDNVKLVETVDSYAVACEFPVYAECTVPGIKDSITVPAGVLQHKTFLESLGLKNIKTYEVDFSRIDSRLRGKMRQSFLVNQHGHITLRNSEARWQLAIENSYGHKRNVVSVVTGDTSSDFHGIYFVDTPYTISCDGVSITGVLGRRMLMEGSRKCIERELMDLHCGQVFFLDVRGGLKPELTPARSPLEYTFEAPRAWAEIFRIVYYASCQLWDDVLRDCTESDMQTFWSYRLLYQAASYSRYSSRSFSGNLILNRLSLPVDAGCWLRMSEIRSFIRDENHIKLLDRDGGKHNVNLFKSIAKWSEHYDSCDDSMFYSILLRTAKLSISGKGEAELVIDHSPSCCDTDTFCRLKSDVVPFSSDLDSRWIMSLTPYLVYNENSPLVRLAAKVWNVKEKDSVELFADNLCESLYDYFVYDLKDERDAFGKPTERLRYAGALYKLLDKSKIDSDFLPPYYILGSGGEKYEISESLLLEWAELPGFVENSCD